MGRRNCGAPFLLYSGRFAGIGYTVTKENDTGTVNKAVAAVSFTNNREMIVPTSADIDKRLLAAHAALLVFAAAAVCILVWRRRRMI